MAKIELITEIRNSKLAPEIIKKAVKEVIDMYNKNLSCLLPGTCGKDSIATAFVWHETPSGEEFWAKIYDNIKL